jgi:hypothetical protein
MNLKNVAEKAVDSPVLAAAAAWDDDGIETLLAGGTQIDRNEPSGKLSEQVEPARSTAQKRAYSLTNPYTTQDEKVEIEAWYQLPMDLAGVAYIVTCTIWARGDITGWQAYVMAFAVGVAMAIALWVAYAKRIVFAVKVLVGSPGVWVVPHIGFAAWLAFTGAWTQAAFLAGNCVLLDFPVGLRRQAGGCRNRMG